MEQEIKTTEDHLHQINEHLENITYLLLQLINDGKNANNQEKENHEKNNPKTFLDIIQRGDIAQKE